MIVKPLCEVAQFISRGITPSYTENEGIVVFNQKCIRDNTVSLAPVRLHDPTKKRVPTEKMLRQYDILVNSTGVGTLGRTAQVLTADLIATVDSHITIIRPSQSIDPLFLGYAVKWKEPEIEALAEGSTGQTELSRTRLGQSIIIPIFDKETQKRIASVLRALDDKIKLNTRINENLYQMIAALYTSISRDTIQPKTTIAYYSKQIYSGGTPSTIKPEYWNGAFHWFSSGETRNRFAITTEKTITQLGIDNSSTKLAHKYDIVMASAGQGFTRGQTTMLLLDTYVNQSVIVIHADKLHLPYLFWNLTSRYDELRAISDSSSIRGSLTTKMIAGLEIQGVDPQSLVTYSDFAWSVIPEIEKNLLENEKLATLRDELLPKLMSGEIDVTTVTY